MLKRLDKIRFRGSKRDDFLDLAESPTASDNEGMEDILMKPRLSLRDPEELREPVSQSYQTYIQVASEPVKLNSDVARVIQLALPDSQS